MADADDLRDLKAGDSDMARRDFRNADLSNWDMSDRDFTAALFKSAISKSSDFSRSILLSIETSKWNAEGSNFSSAKMSSTSIFMVNLRSANFQNADLSRSHFRKCDFSNANLLGTDFRNAHFDEDTKFDGAITDETTLFDGARIFRATARQPAFRYYKVEKGELVRLPAQPEPAPLPSSTSTTTAVAHTFDQSAVDLIDEIGETLKRLRSEQRYGEMGHNGPPVSLPLDTDAHRELIQALDAVRTQAANNLPDMAIVQPALSSIQMAAGRIASWVAEKASLASDEFAKQLGKTLADGKLWLGGVAAGFRSTREPRSLRLALATVSKPELPPHSNAACPACAFLFV